MMISFRRLWFERISDYQLASQVVTGAGVALPAMLLASFGWLWGELALELRTEPPTWTYAFAGFTIGAAGMLGVWLTWRMSKVASLAALLLAAVTGAPLALLLANWVLEVVLDAPSAGFGLLTAVLAITATLLGAGWLATWSLSWRAVRATFAAEKLRYAAQPEKAFN